MLLAFVFFCTFAFSIFATVASWKSYAFHTETWNVGPCIVTDEFVIADGKKQDMLKDTDSQREVSCGNDKFEYFVVVNSPAIESVTNSDTDKFVAVKDLDRFCAFGTKADAHKDLHTEYLKKDERDVTCYYHDLDRVIVQLKDGGYARSTVSNSKKHFIISTIAMSLSTLAFLYSLYHLFLVYRALRNNVTPPRIFHPIPEAYYGTSDQSSRRPLGGHDAHLLIESFEECHDVGGVCAVCLEDLDAQRKAVMLPCDHAYHEDCVTQWFRKGNPSCPYCNDDLTERLKVLKGDTGGREERNEVGREVDVEN